jgi:hypothetical protein
MANQISKSIPEEFTTEPVTRYNELVLLVFRIDSYKKILRGCEVELFDINNRINSLEYEKKLLQERKSVVEKKITHLEDHLKNLDEDYAIKE